MVLHAQIVDLSLAYRFWHPLWDSQRNRQVYGELASAEGWGGNWRMQMGVLAPADTNVDWAPSVALLKKQMDHCCLWLDWPQLQNSPATPEVALKHMADLVFAQPLPTTARWNYLRLMENENVRLTQRLGADAVELSVQVNNIWVTGRWVVDAMAGICMARRTLTQTVNEALKQFVNHDLPEQWGVNLLQFLCARVPQIIHMRVDLGTMGALELSTVASTTA